MPFLFYAPERSWLGISKKEIRVKNTPERPERRFSGHKTQEISLNNAPEGHTIAGRGILETQAK